MLNLIHARTFLTVVETKGVRSAARALDLAPSTVVEHIRQLELELSAPLLERQGGSTTPTPEGLRFLPIARALVATAKRARSLIHQPSMLRLAASSNVGIYLLQQPLAAFQKSTECELETWIGPNTDVLDRLVHGEADLAAMEWWDDRKGFTARMWSREPLVVIVAPDHRWAGQTAIAVEDLLTEPLLGGEEGTGTARVLRKAFGELVHRLNVVDGFGSTEAVKRAVRAGRGASIVLSAAVADEIASRQLVALQIAGFELVKEIKLIVPETLPSTAPAMAFFENGNPA